MTKKQLPDNLHRDTLAVRVALEPSQHGENSEALYLTSGFVQPDAETSARRFADPTEGYTYGRTSNPTVTSFERRLAAHGRHRSRHRRLHRHGRHPHDVHGLLKAGDHVICSRSMFGSTIALIGREFGKFGVETTFVSQTDVAEWKAALRPTTKLLFAETPTNPLTEVCDIRALADLAHSVGALLAVDNCFCSPALQRPVEFGADLIMHSGTKYLDGQGRVMAGALCGPSKYIVDVFGPIVRTAGMTLAPFNAWVVLKGLETLSIRMQAQSANALAVAQWLETQPAVARVYYPGLPNRTRSTNWPCASSRGWAARCCRSTCAATRPKRRAPMLSR
jgi:O-succinylhomoserine sulfhydrylase